MFDIFTKATAYQSSPIAVHNTIPQETESRSAKGTSLSG